MIDFLEVGVLAEPACGAMRAEMRLAADRAAALPAGDGAAPVRAQGGRATRVAVSPRTIARMTWLVMLHKEKLERHFGLALGECEEPQFHYYRSGDFLLPRQDGDTPLVHDRLRLRRISAVIFLGAHSEQPTPGTFGGGTLVLHGPASDPALRMPLPAGLGNLVAFRAETIHEVTPVTHGERFTIESWFPAAT
jgi:SM-20-related protein